MFGSDCTVASRRACTPARFFLATCVARADQTLCLFLFAASRIEKRWCVELLTFSPTTPDVTAQPHNSGAMPAPSAPSRDANLIARILGGERELFHELVRPYE